ncbi:MAG TPA: bifunctional acetate--CoA ligase family protein/GNAT family N-acetyltransferase, partial [Thermoleophilia bacterium]|nr:bifunctional acetate--CoA ligase family protein/GNAT family N-acetyltransferase [Thermoleophilia bacterium]
MSTLNLDKLFDPRSIAVIGASNKKGSVGYILLHNLIGAEYEGVVYPVHQTAMAIQGIQAYATISHVPRKVDLAIVAVPAKAVPDVVRECGEAGVGACVIVSAGFKETGARGRRLEQQVVAAARSYDLRILGPNCLGFVRPGRSLNATFAHVMPEPGRVAFFSQSGALGTAILDWAAANHVGFSAFVSVGSMGDVDFGDLIDYFGADQQTSSIILYIESITDARKFMSAARHFAKSKPIIVVKSGRSARSAQAAASHTGAIAGDDTLYSAAFRRAGIVRVDEIEDLFDASEALSRQTSPKGPRLAIVTNAGGPGVMAADRLLALGGELAALSPETDAKLQAALPGFAARGNPVDVGGDADEVRYGGAAAALMDDPDIDGVLAVLTPQAMSHPDQTASALIDVSKAHPRKPLLTSFMGEIKVHDAVEALRHAHIPTFDTPEDAVRAYMYMYDYTKNLALLYETPTDLLPDFAPDRARVKQIFTGAAKAGRSILSEVEAKEVLAAYEIPTVKTLVVTSPEEASTAAQQLGFPVAMKVFSHDITHKTDVGGVALDIRSAPEAAAQYTKILERAQAAAPQAEILGMVVEEMAPRGGYEVIIGSKHDATFGPALMFGMGGTGVELYRDVTVDFPPLNETLAQAMIRDTKVSRLLRGHRGRAAVDMVALERTLVKFSYLLIDFPEILEMDANPVQVRTDGLAALDARIVIEPKDVRKIAAPGAHLIISMYPSKYQSEFAIEGEKDVVKLRPIRPEDEPLWTEMIGSLSEATQEFRFFGPVREITRSMLVRYLHVDYDREIAIVAVQGQKRKARMLGVARFTKETGNADEGEFAILVRDEYQSRGVGTHLMDALIQAARDQHVRVIYGDVLASNAAMLRFAESLGFDVTP